MVELPHYRWPFALGDLVEQATGDELVASAAVIVCTPRGHRSDRPSFGTTQPLFSQGPVDLERLAAEVTQSDPRLTLDAEETFDLTAATVRTVQLSTGT